MSDPQTQALIDRLDSAGLWAKLSREFYAAGTFTPALVGTGGGSATYTAGGQVGRWVRVGGRVDIWMFISIATTTLSGTLSLVLPFTSITGSRAVVFGVGESVNLTASYTTLYGLILSGTSEFRIREAGDNVATSPLQGSQIAAGSILEFAGVYEVSG